MQSRISTSRVHRLLHGSLLSLAASLTLCGLWGCGSGIKLLGGGSSSPVSAVKDGPQLGYAWKADDRTLRPFLGVAGASQVGESVITAATYTAAAGSSVSGVALLVDSQGRVSSMDLPAGEPTELAVSVSGAAQIRFSPSGTSAIVFSPGAQTASLITALTSQPQVKQLSAANAIRDIAVSDTAAVAAVLQSTVGTSLELISSANPKQALAFTGTGTVTFLAKSDDLLAADGGSGTLVLVRNISSTPVASPIPTGNLLKGPLALGASASGNWAVVANGGESSVVRIDLTGATSPQKISCPEQPDEASQLMGYGEFRFTQLADGPVWIADITQATPSMMFIPALPSSGAGGRGNGAAR